MNTFITKQERSENKTNQNGPPRIDPRGGFMWGNIGEREKNHGSSRLNESQCGLNVTSCRIKSPRS